MYRRSVRSSTLASFLSLSVLSLVGCRPEETVPPPTQAEAPKARFTYPATAMGEVVDDYHGEKIADPYRWLEDLDSPETQAWVAAQNAVTFGYLETIAGRAALRERLTALWNFERYGTPWKEGGRYFWSRNDGLQNQSVIYTARALKDEPKVLLDPNALSADGTVALTGMSVSPNGAMVAYGLAASGSDWQEYRVRDVESGKDREDLLKWIKFSGVAWTKDNKGFFYSRYAEPKEGEALTGQNFDQKLYYHRVGAPQAEDVLIYERPDHPKWGFQGTVTDDGKYLIIEVWEGSAEKNAVFVKELKGKEATTAGGVVEVLKDFDAKYDFIDNSGATLWMFTDKDAPRGKVVAIDLKRPEASAWTVLIPEAAETLRSASSVGGRLLASYLKDAASQVKIFDAKGKARRGGAARDRLRGRPGRQEERQRDVLLVHQLYDARHDLSLRREEERERAVQGADGALQPGRLRDRAGVLSEQGRDEDPDVLGPSQGAGEGRAEPDVLVRVRRLQRRDHAGLLRGELDVAGDGWGLCGAEPARRRRIRQGVARGGHEGAETKRIRRLTSRLPSGSDREQATPHPQKLR
jgi:hypothetical protein